MVEIIKTVLTFGGTVGGGAAIAAALKYFKDKRLDKTTGSQTVLEEYKELYTKSEARIAELETKYEDIASMLGDSRGEVAELKNKLMLMDASHGELPIPYWFKDNNLKVVNFNSHFENYFLQPFGLRASDCRNKTEAEFYASIEGGFCDTISDRYVLNNSMPVFIVEQFTEKDGTVVYLYLSKFPRYVGNVVVGVSGILLGAFKESFHTEHLYINWRG